MVDPERPVDVRIARLGVGRQNDQGGAEKGLQHRRGVSLAEAPGQLPCYRQDFVEARVGRRGGPRAHQLGTGPTRQGGRRVAGQRLGDAARRRLLEARDLFREGAFANAAENFGQMAAIARERGMPRIATHLSARAAACHAKLGATAAFEEWVAQAVADARQDGDKERTSRTFGALLGVLSDTPLAEHVDALRSRVQQELGVSPKERQGEGPVVNRSMRRQLPKVCGSCGAPVNPDEIAFNEDGSVDCNVCGDLLKG